MNDRLYDYERDFAKIAIEKIQNKFFFAEIPTGGGKSVISADIAETLAKQGKKVIISTYTNQLAREIALILQNKNPKITPKFDGSIRSGLAVGKGNYFDTEKITPEIRELFLNPVEFDIYIDSLEGMDGYYYLFDTLFESVSVDKDNQEIIKRLISADGRDKRKDYMTDIGDYDIAVTNHSYFLYKAYQNDFNFKEYAVIFDEADKLLESAESVLTSNFSVSRLKNLSEMLLRYLAPRRSERGYKAGINHIAYIRRICAEVIRNYTNKTKSGEYYRKESLTATAIIRSLASLASTAELHRAEKFIKNNIKTPLAGLFVEELSELGYVKSKQADIRVYCSSSGEPSLHFLRKNIAGELYYRFWSNIEGCLGMSATLTVGTDRDETRNYIYSRLGFNYISAVAKNIEERLRELENSSLKEDETNKEADKLKANLKDLAEQAKRIKGKMDTVYVMSPCFKSSQADIFICGPKFPPPAVSRQGINHLWTEECSKIIKDTWDGKNSLVLTGSFEEVNILSGFLAEWGVPVIKAEPGKSSYFKVKEFKEKGGVLIGTRNYGTGIDLPGKEVERLYITKLPFPILNSRRFLELKEKRKDGGNFRNINEMLLSLRQYLGRLIRTPKDTGKIYILDSRLYNRDYHRRLIPILKNYGTLKDKKIK